MKLAIIQAQTGVLSDNNQNKPNFNTVIPSQKEMGRVGFEPTTSAMPAFKTGYHHYLLSKPEPLKETVQIPPGPF